MRLLVPVLVWATALGSGASARAADAPPLRISVPACPSSPFAVEAFLGSLEVELAGHVPPCCVLTTSPPAEGPGLLVALRIDPCDANATSIIVEVRDPARAGSAERKVELSDIAPEARPRALALAVAELVHSATQAPPPPPTAPAVSAPGPTTATRSRTPTLFLSGALELEPHPGNNMLLWGLGASLGVARGHWMGAVDLQGLNGGSSVALGDVSTDLLAVALTVGPRWSLGRLMMDLGATGRVGWAWMNGQAGAAGATAGSGSAPFASAGGRLGIFLPTRAGVSHLRALVEAGAMIRGLEATVNDAPAAGLSGGYLLFGLGFGENR
jgi:hypothetical protein